MMFDIHTDDNSKTGDHSTKPGNRVAVAQGAGGGEENLPPLSTIVTGRGCTETAPLIPPSCLPLK